MSREVKVGNEWVRVAGRGKAEYGASHYQTGTISSDAIAAYTKVTQEVTFEKEMPDSDYIVNFDSSTSMRIAANAISKTKTGFKIELFNVTSTESSAMSVKWQAFKLYSDKEYDGLLDDVATLNSEVAVKSAYTSGNGTTVSTTLNNVQGTSWNPIYVFYDRNIYLISIGTNTNTLTIHNVVNNTGVELSSATLTKVSGNTYTLSLTFGAAIYNRCFIHYR